MGNYSPTVLVVDDEKSLRIGTKRLLESEGYTVECAEDGSTGIKIGCSKSFDIAIIDLRMPDINGIDVLKEILHKFPNTVCFIATAFASIETAIEATKIGAYSYIPKPFSPDELLFQLSKGYEKRLLTLEAEKLQLEREERLLEVAFEKTRLNTIINSIADGVLVVNKEGEIVLFNPGVLKMLGIEKLSVGDHIKGVIRPEILEIIDAHLSAPEYSETSFSKQVEIKPEHELVIEVTCSPVPQSDGSLAGVVAVMRNITELKKIDLLKSQFVSMVAHELKTPIAAALGFLKLILDPSVEITREQETDFLTRSEIRLESLITMVNDLLDISRMELKKVNREIKEIELGGLLKSIAELLEIEMRKRELEVKFILPDTPLHYRADYNEINRLFTNLMSNAIKYNRPGGSITVEALYRDNYLTIKISDTGIGMKPEDKARLFTEFFRAKNEKTRGISGTGLGLSIVKRIVDSYSGIIDVESEYGAGSSFIVSLPL